MTAFSLSHLPRKILDTLPGYYKKQERSLLIVKKYKLLYTESFNETVDTKKNIFFVFEYQLYTTIDRHTSNCKILISDFKEKPINFDVDPNSFEI